MNHSNGMSRRQVLQAAMTLSLSTSAGARAVARPRGKRATFLLVHGSWHGGWCYARVAEILRGEGHRVFTPTLTGLGDRSHLARCGSINCSTHIQDVVNLIQWEQLSEVVLCGHSYGGVVIAGVADFLPERIDSIVYLDAVIPRNGESALAGAEPQQLIELLKAVSEHGGQMLPPLPAARMNVNPADRAMVDALCTPQPFATLTECLELRGAHMEVAKKTFVLATDWPGSAAIQRAYQRVRQDTKWTALEVPYGHDVMLDAPARLAEILLDAR